MPPLAPIALLRCIRRVLIKAPLSEKKSMPDEAVNIRNVICSGGKPLSLFFFPTGLDPAFPLYMFSGKKGHLASTDAEFVDVIHTDGGVFGFPIALGDADFFPNGGFPAQPGCRINSLLQKNQIKRIGE